MNAFFNDLSDDEFNFGMIVLGWTVGSLIAFVRPPQNHPNIMRLMTLVVWIWGIVFLLRGIREKRTKTESIRKESLEMIAPGAPAQTPSPVIAQDPRLAELSEIYKELAVEKRSLNKNDSEAVAAFNKKAAFHKARLDEFRKKTAESK